MTCALFYIKILLTAEGIEGILIREQMFAQNGGYIIWQLRRLLILNPIKIKH